MQLKNHIPLALSIFLLLCCFTAFSQVQLDSGKITPLPATPTSEPSMSPKAKIENDRFGFLTDLEFTLSISVLLFGVLVFFLEAYLIKIKKIDHEHVMKIVLITLIVIGTLFLITAGYNNNQIAPATGLLGTIAGYLLGKTTAPERPSAADENNKSDKNEA